VADLEVRLMRKAVREVMRFNRIAVELVVASFC
jgi:hypothetical protein